MFETVSFLLLDNCLTIAGRIMSGGLAEQSNVIDLGDIILEVNNIPIHSAEDLSALVRRTTKRIGDDCFFDFGSLFSSIKFLKSELPHGATLQSYNA